MRNVYDPDFRAEATSTEYGLTETQVQKNLAWYARWDAFCEECSAYDALVPAALKGDIPIPEVPVQFWGKGKPRVPYPPPKKKKKIGRPPKEMTVAVTLHIPLSMATQIEKARAGLSAAEYLMSLLVELLPSVKVDS